jgi:hypothetical protein
MEESHHLRTGSCHFSLLTPTSLRPTQSSGVTSSDEHNDSYRSSSEPFRRRRGAQAEEPAERGAQAGQASPGRAQADWMRWLGWENLDSMRRVIKNTALSIYKSSTAPGSLLHTLG